MGTVAAKRGRRGMALVEMSLILLLLVMLLFGVMEYSWMFLRMQEVTNAARAGARYAVIPDADNAGIEQRVTTLLNASGISGATVTVSMEDVSEAGTGDPVTVTVSVPYATNHLLGMSIFPTPATLQATATMAKEGP